MAKTKAPIVPLTPDETKLVDWFKALYAARTPATDLREIDPAYRISWHEVRAKAQDFNLPSLEVAFRMRFQQIMEQHIRKDMNKLLVANGEKPLPKADSSTIEIMASHGFYI